MSDSKKQNPSASGGDDINRLFAKMGGGQGHASAYRDFTYNKLPGRPPQPASADASTEAKADARVEVQGATVAPLRKLRVAEVEVAPVEIDVEVEVEVVAVTPLQQMFQRLLAAEAPNQASGPLKRLFSR